jgi:radical SAM protein with 4Fe4S-binding SPASM domain
MPDKVLKNIKGNYRDLNQKSYLGDVIPLDTPYKIYIEPSTYCNIKCNFCYHAMDEDKLNELGYKPDIMSIELFKECVDNIAMFPNKLRAFKFAGLGEPLLNKKIVEMIAYAKFKNIADKTTLVTNGILLNPKLNEELVLSGLDEVIISVEALSSEKYLDITQVRIDFEKFCSNIKDLYNRKQNMKLFIKIADIGLEGESEKKFHDIFDSISDIAYVECISNIFDNVNYENIISDESVNQIGERCNKRVEVCYLPFYNLYINARARVSPCVFDYKNKIVVGDIKKTDLVKIWNGKKLNQFRIMHLKKEREKHPYCKRCEWLSICACGIYENIIDDDAERLLKYFEKSDEVYY